jgi:Arc/MetJ family transcription regulator
LQKPKVLRTFAVFYLNKILFDMKRFILLFIAIAITGVFGSVTAQDKSKLSDKDLSDQYKYEIKLLESEIKTTKIKLKADRNNIELKNDLTAKSEQLKELKSKKGIIDKAIKSKVASEKAAKKAEKAQQKAEQYASDAQKVKEKEKEKEE